MPATPATADGYVLTTGRGLYTSYEGAAVHSPEADRLHREEFVEVNPADAKELGVSDGAEVTLKANGSELTLRARVTAAVQPRMLYVPLYFEGGAFTALFTEGAATVHIEIVAGGR